MESPEEVFKNYWEEQAKEEKRMLAENADLIHNFRKICLKRNINLNDSDFRYIPPIGVVALYPDLIKYLCPDILIGKDGLIDFNLLCKLFKKQGHFNGFLFGEDFMVMAHPYFRRGYSEINNFAPRFLEYFWKLDNPAIHSYLAIDPNRVRINVDNSMYMEFDTWFGSKFNKDISQIPNGIVKLRPPFDLKPFDISFFFHDAYSLDIKWEIKDGIKSFQAEEFKSEDVKIKRDGVEVFPVRYVHSEFNIKEGCFIHLDGAIHFYTPEEYFERRDSDFNYNLKNRVKIKSNSLKLFRMDGKIPIDIWIEYISQFLTGNPLVFEYFEGKYPDHIQQIMDKLKQE